MAYDPNAWYKFTDKDGNTFTSRGDNGYVWQAITEGIPISVDSKGNWYTEPYLDVSPTGYVAHIPNWFKQTDEYSQWQTYASQIPNLSVNETVFNNLKDVLKSLGSQGAMRTALTSDIKSYGVTDQNLINKYIKDIVNMAAEGQGGDKAKITLWGTEYNSAADIARHYKELSKEGLSKAMTSMYDIMDKGQKGEWKDKEEYLADAVTAAKILNYIDDNHISYGKDDEFNGLLSSSVWQQINRGLTQFMGGISSNTFVGIPARVAYGAMNASTGKDFSLKIEDLYNERLATGSDLGAGLEGNDAADVVGMWGGAIGSIAVTMATSMMMGSAINGKVAASAPGGFWNNVGNFAQTIPGAAVSDFFLNDVPLDLMIFTTDTMRDGIGKAWFDPENPQPLFGIPFIRQGQDGNFYPSGFGPDVPGGLAMNMVGDAVLDAAIPFLGIVGNSTYKGLDNLTNGAVTRVREKAALLNLQVQQKLTNIPILGTGWQKFVNYMMGAENAQYMREARKAAIAEGSMEPYVRAQNLLTLTNHSGMEVVSPLYKQLDNELGISKSLKEFQQNAKTYGGNGETKVEWKEIKRGVEQKFSKTVPDTIPRQVKQGLLDTERLAELRGEEKNEGGLLTNPARQKEIAEIEARLEKTPQEIKDFAQKFSELNKRVEALGVDLGITKQEWIDALQLDPRWESYMTRQALVPGGGAVSTGTNAPDAKILTAKRKGYYADNYIDPTLALGMKVEALGRAFAWNERAKALVSFEISQGKVIAGKAGVDVAARLAEVKEQIKQGTEFRKSIGYDEQLGSIRTDTETISGAFRKINDLLNLPEQLSLKSVYEATQNPRIKEFISNFNNGKIQFADGVKEAAGLSDSEAATIVQNTYVQKGDNVTKLKETEIGKKSELFDDSVADLSAQVISNTGAAVMQSRLDEILDDILNNKRSVKDVRNGGGEIDLGIYGITPEARRKYDKKARQELDLKNKKIDAEIAKVRKEIAKLEKQESKWVEKRGDYIAKHWGTDARTYDEAEAMFLKEFPAPDKRITELLDKESELMGQKDYGSRSSVMMTFNIDTKELVDSSAPIPFNQNYSTKSGEDWMQQLTRGEVRRALYEDGYDNLSKKFKTDVDKADNAFTQRLTEDLVLYRGETSGTNRTINVGDNLDTKAWTYTALTPQYTDTYRNGLTGGKIDGDNKNGGYIFRYHVKEGTPVYVPTDKPRVESLDTDADIAKAFERTSYEFIFPREIEARVIGISKEKLDDTPFGDKVTVVDVEVNPNSGYAPKLRIQEIGNIGPIANVPDTANAAMRMKIESSAAKANYNAGVTANGIPYKYTVEGGKITSFEKLETSEDYATAISTLGGVYNISASTIDSIGKPNTEGIIRTILYYRDNMPNIGTGPTYHFDSRSGSWGYIQSAYSSTYGWKLVDGHIQADQYAVFLGNIYRAGNEADLFRRTKEGVDSGWWPKNTQNTESTPIHEGGHSLMMQLAVHRLNRMADEGLIKLPEGSFDLSRVVNESYEDLHNLFIDKAMKKMGYEKYTEADVDRMANTISEYASSTNYGKDHTGKWKHDEIMSEAQNMYAANGQNSSKFCIAIVEAMKEESSRYANAAAPAEVFAKNNLTAPKGLFKDDQYAFPSKVKTSNQKAKWLDEWRQNNPYIKKKGMLSEQDYQLANLWDTYFQKEIYSFNPNSKTSMPDLLSKKNGDFLEDLASNAAKKMVAEIKQASIEGFDEHLATMALSRNSSDIATAMDEFIIGRVNKAAEGIAEKMVGGKTEDNLNTARMTLWSDSSVRNDFANLVASLSPDIDAGNINSKIAELFDTQAKGYATVEALPVDTKKLIGEQNKLTEKLYKENNYARAKGKAVDGELKNYRGEVTQVVHYKEAGEDVYVVVSDPVLADILKKPNDYKETGIVVESLAQAANFVSRAYRLGTTGANPIAFVRNVLRDPMQATIQGGFNPLNMNLSPEVFYHTLRNFGLDDATIKNVTTRLQTWAGSGGMTAEMRNMGVTTPGTIGYRDKVEKWSKKFQTSDGKFKHVVEKAEAPLETWESMFRNQIAQQSFVKNYERYKDVNRAMGMALFDASNSTTNFSHSVGLFKRATSTVPYLSSAINGTRSFWVQFNLDPIGMMTRITAGFMVPAMAITAWNLSSQERRDAYMNLPEWYKQSHLVLIDLEGNAVAFPIPEELEQYYGTARKLMEFTQEATPWSIPQILAQGAFGFLPVDTDGFFKEDGTIDFARGWAQLGSGLLPQAVTAIYEFIAEKDLFTGQDLSNYKEYNKWLNALGNVLGTGFKTVINDIGMLLGASEKDLVGKSTADTLARDLFGVGFDNAKMEFMELVGNPSEVDPETGKETAATGLFAENEKLQKQLQNLNAQIVYSDESKKAELEEQKQTLINNFTDRVKNLTNKYMSLYTQTGGLEEWQKEKLVKVLTLGISSSSGSEGSYQSTDSSAAYLNERSLAQQRYVNAGLPAGPSLEAIGDNGSIDLQAAINRFYGVNKQATQDFKNVVEASGMKDVKEEFYSVMQKIYDAADEQGKDPDYDLIERIQARYLQMMDAALIPIINQYGVNVLNNNDFIDAVRRQVNGMIPSDDWRQSVRNAKKFLSTKDFPTAGVDVKKWLKNRYSSGMRDRGLDSDSEVTERINSIKNDIDAGRYGSAKGKIEDLKTGVQKANFYISSKDLQTLNELYNMVK